MDKTPSEVGLELYSKNNETIAKNLAKKRVSTGFTAYIGYSSGDTEKVVLGVDH